VVAHLAPHLLKCFLYVGHVALPVLDFMSPLILPNIIERPEWQMLLSRGSKYLSIP
jgi:hypothetical protein